MAPLMSLDALRFVKMARKTRSAVEREADAFAAAFLTPAAAVVACRDMRDFKIASF